MAAVRPPDAAIVDLVLPDADGVDVTRTLREWSEMPILVLSAVGEEEQKVRALEAGADDYITKPFGARELVARLQAALRRAGRAEEEPTITVEGLEVDLGARIVRRDSEPVHLTPIEFELLRVLVRNRGRLMTHSKLIAEVWGPEYVDDIQPLRTHIARLRAKIEPEGEGGTALHRDRPRRGLPLRLVTVVHGAAGAPSRTGEAVRVGADFHKSAVTKSLWRLRGSLCGRDVNVAIVRHGHCLSRTRDPDVRDPAGIIEGIERI